MGQEGSEAWIIPTYKFYFEDDYTTRYKYEMIENNNENYFQLYSAKEYKAKTQEVEVETELKTNAEKIREGLKTDRKIYES